MMKPINKTTAGLTVILLVLLLPAPCLHAGGPGEAPRVDPDTAAGSPVSTIVVPGEASPERPPAAAPSQLTQARQAYQAANFKKAVAITQEGLRKDPDNLDMLLIQGAALRRMKQHAAATKVYDKVLQLDPSNQSARFIQSLLYLQMSRQAADKSESLAHLARATEAINADPQFIVGRVEDLLAAGDIANAVRTYEYLSAVVELPEPITIRLADACRCEKVYKEAERLYGKVLTGDPGHAVAALGMGLALIEQDEFLAALEAVDSAVKANPGNISLLVAKGSCQQGIDRRYAAIQTYRKVLALEAEHGHAASETARILAELGCVSLAANFIAGKPECINAEVRALVAQKTVLAGDRHSIADSLVTGDDPPLVVLGYQDIPPQITEGAFAVQTDTFIQQIEYLRMHGYEFVDAATLLSAMRGQRALPKKSALLTFDGGCASFYLNVMPILDLYDCPALVAVCPRWIDSGAPPTIKTPLMSWDQVREAASNDLFTVASFSQNLHSQVPMNPQGDLGPSASTRRFDAATAQYETEARFRSRVSRDLKASVAAIESQLGSKPRHLVWPSGAANRTSLDEAHDIGFRLSFTHRNSHGKAGKLIAVKRVLVTDNPSLSTFARELRREGAVTAPASGVMRGVTLNLDLVFSSSIAEQQQNLNAAITRIDSLGVNTVYVRAFSDQDMDGNTAKVFFPNHRLPVRSDILSHAVMRLKNLGLRVYVSMPTMSVSLPNTMLTQQLRVMEYGGGTVISSTSWSKRLSPFAEKSAEIMSGLYSDLATFVPFDGVVFLEDAFLTDKEDFNPAASRKYRELLGRDDFEPGNASEDELATWTEAKSRQLTRFTQMLMTAVRRSRPHAASARALHAPALHVPESEEWLAQNYESALAVYDQVIILANPDSQDIPRPSAWLRWLTELAADHPNGLEKTVFQLNAFDAGKHQWVRERELLYRIEALVQAGAMNIAYDSDDFLVDRPRVARMRDGMSTMDRDLLREPIASKE